MLFRNKTKIMGTNHNPSEIPNQHIKTFQMSYPRPLYALFNPDSPAPVPPHPGPPDPDYPEPPDPPKFHFLSAPCVALQTTSCQSNKNLTDMTFPNKRRETLSKIYYIQLKRLFSIQCYVKKYPNDK